MDTTETETKTETKMAEEQMKDALKVPTDFVQLALETAKGYLVQAKVECDLLEAKAHMLKVEIEITPETGWPGKSEADRSQAAQVAYHSSMAWQDISEKVLTLSSALIITQAQIKALETMRRALEDQTKRDEVNLSAQTFLKMFGKRDLEDHEQEEANTD